MVNRLSQETSPYLQQHKNNPVEWWPYGDEAFDEARKLDRPIFISIGYSTCHWCHVMARESFSDEDTAKFMNENFVNVKIDREEYPGVDKAYQEMYQLLNRRGGGWPLSVFAHPDGSPFFIGTYFPKDNKFGMHSFMSVNNQIMDAWKKDRDTLDKQATSLVRGLRSLGEHMYGGKGTISEDLYYKEIIGIQSRFDKTYGGIGSAPKFPRVSVLRFLLQEGATKKLKEITDFVYFTFTKMSLGGIYDQLGGGFARYSVDTKWLVPHFEKMLYDNAMLLQLGAELYAYTKDQFLNSILRDLISFLAREMRSPQQAFYSAINADSEGREGKFYVWHVEDVETILGKDYKIAEHRYGLTKKGNFEDPHHSEIKGMNVLHIAKSIPQIAKDLKKSENEIIDKLNEIKIKLFQEREKRIRPSTDTKILVSWNGLAIRALFIAAEVLDFPQAGGLAINALEFIIENMIEDGKITRSFHERTDEQVDRKIEGVLDDYSFLIGALIQAFEYTDEWRYIQTAEKLLNVAKANFYDDEAGIYFVNTSSENSVLGRIVQISDDSMPSGIGLMPYNLFKLGKYLDQQKLVDEGKDLFEQFAERINDYPGAMGNLLISGTQYLRYPMEIVIVNDLNAELFNAHTQNYISHRLVYRWNDKNKDDGRPEWEVLEQRTGVEQPTVFICEGMTCSLPLTTSESVKEELTRLLQN